MKKKKDPHFDDDQIDNPEIDDWFYRDINDEQEGKTELEKQEEI